LLYAIFIKKVFCTFKSFVRSKSKLNIINSKEGKIDKMQSKIGITVSRKEEQNR